jgi:hypothetical protein
MRGRLLWNFNGLFGKWYFWGDTDYTGGTLSPITDSLQLWWGLNCFRNIRSLEEKIFRGRCGTDITHTHTQHFHTRPIFPPSNDFLQSILRLHLIYRDIFNTCISRLTSSTLPFECHFVNAIQYIASMLWWISFVFFVVSTHMFWLDVSFMCCWISLYILTVFCSNRVFSLNISCFCTLKSLRGFE